MWLTTIGGLDWPHSYAQTETSIKKQKKELKQKNLKVNEYEDTKNKGNNNFRK